MLPNMLEYTFFLGHPVFCRDEQQSSLSLINYMRHALESRDSAINTSRSRELIYHFYLSEIFYRTRHWKD